MKIGDLVQYVDLKIDGMPDVGIVIRINEDNYEVFWFNDNSYMAHYKNLIFEYKGESI